MVHVVIALLAFVGAMATYYGLPWAYVLMARWRLQRQARNRRFMVLTFDDGPGTVLTPAILSSLRQQGCKASFFVLGRNVRGREHIIRRLREEGHDVYSHGYHHLDHWKVSPFRAIADIKDGWRALETGLGTDQEVYLFRPPFGRLNLASLVYLLWKRAGICLWTIDSGDSSDYAETLSADWCLQESLASGGGVLLYHDFDRQVSSTQQYVLASVDAVVRATNKQGLACGSLSDLWANRAETPPSRSE